MKAGVGYAFSSSIFPEFIVKIWAYLIGCFFPLGIFSNSIRNVVKSELKFSNREIRVLEKALGLFG